MTSYDFYLDASATLLKLASSDKLLQSLVPCVYMLIVVLLVHSVHVSLALISTVYSGKKRKIRSLNVKRQLHPP